MNWELLNQVLSQTPVLMGVAWLIPAIISIVAALASQKGGTSTTSTSSTNMGLPPELQAQLLQLFQSQERQIGNLDPLQQAVAQMAMKRLPTRYQQPMPWTPWSAMEAPTSGGGTFGGGPGPLGGVTGGGTGGAAGGGGGDGRPIF